MLGLPDFWIALGYVACILSAIFCLVYSVATWNKGADAAAAPEDVEWAAREDEQARQDL